LRKIETLGEENEMIEIFVQRFYSPLISFSASSSLGMAGIAPFLVVVIAPHALAYLSTSLNRGSS